MRLSRCMKAFVGIASLVLLASCTPDDQQVKQDSPTELRSVSSHIKEFNKDILEDATTVQKQAESAKSDVDRISSDANRPITGKINNSLADISSRADQIIDGSKRIAEETKSLDRTLSDISDMEKTINDLKTSLEEARKAALQRLYTYITMFWVIGFIVIIGGAILSFFVNKMMGLTLSMVGVLMIGFASASHYYLQEIAMIGGIIIIGTMLFGVGLLVWSMINAKRSSTAVKEIVEMIEILKESMLDSEKERIFGNDGLASKVQSDITKEVIAEIKKRNGFKRLAELRDAAASTTQQQETPPKPPQS